MPSTLSALRGRSEFSIYLNFALAEDDPQAALQAIIQESFPGESGDPLLQTLATLTSDDFAASPYVASDPSITRREYVSS